MLDWSVIFSVLNMIFIDAQPAVISICVRTALGEQYIHNIASWFEWWDFKIHMWAGHMLFITAECSYL